MPELYDVAAIGNAIVDVIAPATDAWLDEHGLTKGAMMLVDPGQSAALYSKMAAGVEAYKQRFEAVPGAEPNAEPGAEPGAESGAESGVEPGTDGN